MEESKICRNCRWHYDFTGACTNSLSPNCADYTLDEDGCAEWEEIKADPRQPCGLEGF